MRVVVDAFGGDNAPLEIVKGAAMASKEFAVLLLQVTKEQLKTSLRKRDLNLAVSL